MEALILTSALLALARFLTKKKESESDAAGRTTAPSVVRDPPPSIPPPAPPSWRPPESAEDRARLERAHALALQVAQTIKAQGKAYSREIVGAFQREAGLVVDGVYGPRTAGALRWYTNESIPPLTGRGFDPYVPFGSAKGAASSKAPVQPATPPARPPVAPPSPPKPASNSPTGAPEKAAPSVPSQTRPSTTETPQAKKPVPPFTPKQKPAPTAPVKEPPQTKPTSPSVPPKSEAPRAAEKGTAPTTSTAIAPVPDRAQLDRAAALAKQVAESVKTAGKAYDRGLVTAFQREAGLAADGLYGPRTAGAIKWYTNESIPPPGGGTLAPYAPKLDAPAAPSPKVEPPRSQRTPESSPAKAAPTAPEGSKPAGQSAAVRDTARLDRAAALAKRAAENLKAPAAAYDRALMTEFQREAGLTADGVYGPRSAGAIKWYTGESITPKMGHGFVQYVPNF